MSLQHSWAFARKHVRRVAMVLVLAIWSVLGGLAAGQTNGIAEKHHPWGRFKPGAWKMVRVVTETLDAKGVVTSTSIHDIRTILRSIEKDAVSLEMQITVEVAGKRFEMDPQVVQQAFHSEVTGVNATAQAPVESEVTVEGKKIPCHLMRLEYTGPNNSNQTVSSLYYSDTLPPFVLRRETTTTDGEAKAPVGESTVEVVALNLPCRASGEIKTAALVKSSQKNAKTTSVTYAFTSVDVPGGVMSHTSKELDKDGHVLRRSTLELLDFGLQCDEEPAGLLRKRRPRLRDSMGG